MRILGKDLLSVSDANQLIESILGAPVFWEPGYLSICQRSPKEVWIVLKMPFGTSVVVECHLIPLEGSESEHVIWAMERPRFSFRRLEITPMSVISFPGKKGGKTGSRQDRNNPG
jgi:hypothetical protein